MPQLEQPQVIVELDEGAHVGGVERRVRLRDDRARQPACWEAGKSERRGTYARKRNGFGKPAQALSGAAPRDEDSASAEQEASAEQASHQDRG